LNVEEGGLRFKVLKKKEDYINYLEQEIEKSKIKNISNHATGNYLLEFYSFLSFYLLT
jgi:hypothetical protein